MLFPVSDFQFITYATRLYDAYYHCNTAEIFERLAPSFRILQQQQSESILRNSLIVTITEMRDTAYNILYKKDTYARTYN